MGGIKKATKSVTNVFNKVTKEIARVPENASNMAKSVVNEIERVPENVGSMLADAVGGGDNSTPSTVIQESADKAKQRFALEEGQETEQGATDIKTRLGVGDRKKIKRLSIVKK